MAAVCTVPGCKAEIPTVVRYVPLDEDRYLETQQVDLPSWVAHLRAVHPEKTPAPPTMMRVAL